MDIDRDPSVIDDRKSFDFFFKRIGTNSTRRLNGERRPRETETYINFIITIEFDRGG